MNKVLKKHKEIEKKYKESIFNTHETTFPMNDRGDINEDNFFKFFRLLLEIDRRMHPSDYSSNPQQVELYTCGVHKSTVLSSYERD